MVKGNERIDDLECRGYKIIQKPDGYCFTSDSVLLANFVKAGKKDKVVDLCTGSGVIALLMDAKYSPKSVTGVEIQERLADMAARSVALNGAEDRIKIINAPVQGITKIIGNGYDVVTVNPPYEKKGDKENPTEEEICRAEYRLTLEETVKESASLLRYGGLFYMINKTRRLADAVYFMRKYGIEPKKINFVYPKKDKNSDTFIVEGKRGGNPDLTVPPPTVVYEDNGEYTQKAKELYNK